MIHSPSDNLGRLVRDSSENLRVWATLEMGMPGFAGGGGAATVLTSSSSQTESLGAKRVKQYVHVHVHDSRAVPEDFLTS